MSLPSNITVSSHPCLQAKLSQLRSMSTSARETKSLVHELSLLLASEALGKTLSATSAGEDVSHMGVSFPVAKTSPGRIVLVPVLRSGLAMVDGNLYSKNNRGKAEMSTDIVAL
jgi:uracil phosphoribosyltransferase